MNRTRTRWVLAALMLVMVCLNLRNEVQGDASSPQQADNQPATRNADHRNATRNTTRNATRNADHQHATRNATRHFLLLHGRQVEFVGPLYSSCDANLTIVISLFGAVRPYLKEHVLRIARENAPLVDRIILSWNDPPLQQVAGFMSALAGETRVPILAALHPSNELGNRFSFGHFICTETVLHLDDDVYMGADLLSASFGAARAFPDRIVGLYCAGFRMDAGGANYKSWGYGACGRDCSLALTGVAFLNRRYHVAFFDDKHHAARAYVEEQATGEDILMNFVVAAELARRRGGELPALPVGKESRPGSLGSALKFCARRCMPNNTTFTIAAGHDRQRKAWTLASKSGAGRRRRNVLNYLGDTMGWLPRGSSTMCMT